MILKPMFLLIMSYKKSVKALLIASKVGLPFIIHLQDSR